MENVYDRCPAFENEEYRIRFISISDCGDLLLVYSDEKAVPFFNSDNCGDDDFHYITIERMRQAINFWQFEYERRGFVRWSILDKSISAAIGTIELFHRDSNDFFTDCGLLRLDLRSDYEKADRIRNILSLILQPAFLLFDCGMLATKAVPCAAERIKALESLGFELSSEKLVGHGGTEYTSYFVLNN
jgi:hypothetical protein